MLHACERADLRAKTERLCPRFSAASPGFDRFGNRLELKERTKSSLHTRILQKTSPFCQANT
jgi:hypothetical protein